MFRHIKHLDDLGPGRLLAVVNLSQIEQMPRHPTSMSSHLFGDTPVAVVLTVLEPVMALQKWSGHINAPHLITPHNLAGRG
jgi:hypothetical protein